MEPNIIERDIYNTLAYFDYLQYPLTVFEIFKWQYRPKRVYSYFEIEQTLRSSLWLNKRVGTHEGMYAIGNDSSVELQVLNRKRRFLDSVKKQKKVERVIKYICRLSSVRGVAICNTLANHFTREKSDIDLFVITKTGRVWSARFWSVLPMLILRQRPGETNNDAVDLSFFVSESAFDFSILKIQEEDPYLAFWIKNLSPIYGDEKLWSKFFVANAWADMYLPNAHSPRRSYHMRFEKIKWCLPSIIPERIIKRVQEMRFPEHLKNIANKDTRVVVNDHILKFHTTDRRAEIADAFERKCVENIYGI